MLAALISVAFFHVSTRHLTLKIGTGDDDFRNGSKLDLKVVTRSGALVPIEIARGQRFPDRTTQTIGVDLPRDLEIDSIEHLELRYYNRHRDFMEDDKWRFNSLEVKATVLGGTQTLYDNPHVDQFFQSDTTWSTGTLATFRRSGGFLIQVNDEIGRPQPNTDLFLNNVNIGHTNSAGQFTTLTPITSASQLIARSRIHEQDYYRSHHSDDSTQNWNYRVYQTNVRIDNSGTAIPEFSVAGDRVNVVVKKRQALFGLNLLYCIQMDEHPSDNAKWINLVMGVSQFLYNATDGQFFVDHVVFTKQSQNWDDSDGRIVSDNGYRANVPNQTGGFLGQNIAGTCMMLSRANDSPTLSHEFGHYGLDVRDEYSDDDGNLKCTLTLDTAGSPFQMNQPKASCMMWSQWNAGKICSSISSNPHRDGTRQGSQSCWDKLVSRWNRPGSAELITPSARGTVLGTITMGGTPVGLNYMMPTISFEGTSRPGILPSGNLRVVNSSGSAEAGAKVWMQENGPGGHNFYIGTTDSGGNITVEGSHWLDTFSAQSMDGLRLGSVANTRTLASTLVVMGPTTEAVAQVRPDKGKGKIIIPQNRGLLPIPVEARLVPSLEFTVEKNQKLEKIDRAVLELDGGRAGNGGKVMPNADGTWTIRFGTYPEANGTVYVFGTAKDGQPAFGTCAITLATLKGGRPREVFGPAGQIGLSLFTQKTQAAKILIAETSMVSGADSQGNPSHAYRILSDEPSVLEGCPLEFRVPISRRGPRPRLTLLIGDKEGKNLKPVAKAVDHRGLNLITAKGAGEGTYVVQE
ncbi:MAG: hypothetical protein JST12_09570 [Armatimonadetes bacterium]|nr:hypothetical protein [Armatimonadota bacterium]